MTVAELHALIAVVDGLGEHALAAALARPVSQEALVDALLQAADVLRQNTNPALAALGERCCSLGARLVAEGAGCSP